MNTPTVFAFESAAVRVFSIDGEPWWVARDVCSALEIKNSRDALSRLDDDEKGVGLTDTLGGEQSVQIINEPGLYRLIFSSRLDAAQRFKRWLAHEVLPQIRRTGQYQPADRAADMPPDEATDWLALVGEARRTFGRKVAAEIWMRSPLRALLPGTALDNRLSPDQERVLSAVFAAYEVCGDGENLQPTHKVIANVRIHLDDATLTDRAIARVLSQCLDGYRDPPTGVTVRRVKSSRSFYRGLVLKNASCLHQSSGRPL